MFVGKLEDFQIEGANRLCGRKLHLLSLPQGFGKTVVAIASAEKLLELAYIKNVLVLCPASIVWQWELKIKEFTDGTHVKTVESEAGSQRIYSTDKGIYTVVPYSVFRKDYDAIQKEPWDLIIADEAQEFSSFRSKTFKLIRSLQPSYRWALTGTAISNELLELYTIMQWVDKYYLPPWPKFEKNHIVRRKSTQQIIKYKNLKALHSYLSQGRMFRRTEEDLRDKVPKIIPYRVFVNSNTETQVLEQELFSVLEEGTDRGFQTWSDFSPALHSVRKELAHYKLDKAEELIYKILDESSDNKVLIFSFYKEPLYELNTRLRVPAVFFTGDQKGKKEEAITEFKENARVLIASNAGKHGLDLPFANYTIHLDVPFSHGVTDQRSTRTRRMGSAFDKVTVIYLLVKDSIDEFYYSIVKRKEMLASAVQEGETDTVVMRPISLLKHLEQHYENRRSSPAVETTKEI